ncbi:MAG: HNH endonuclease [Sphingomonadales bacterium]|nr:HNH endonuclease [Sphingomonadales bacterium]
MLTSAYGGSVTTESMLLSASPFSTSRLSPCMTLTSATIVLPSGRTAVVRGCAHCQKSFAVPPSRAKHGRGKHCSPACQYEAMTARKVANTSRACVGCGGGLTAPASRVAAGRGLYCTRECRDRTRIRELHPQFKGRPVHHRGPNWMAQRRKATPRDAATCQHCGAPGVDVHHIVPFRLFDDYVTANDLGNLVTLCKPCHRRADAEVQRAA